ITIRFAPRLAAHPSKARLGHKGFDQRFLSLLNLSRVHLGFFTFKNIGLIKSIQRNSQAISWLSKKYS
ncbi:MAG: hypothetical protein JXK51_00250, partial [Halothiobacillaceae bacterium]|nr:hypothetical protein [Halothiobacillaceae bacterium]